MKNLVLLLLFSVFAFAQTDKTISVVSAEKMNIVYLGIDNPIKIIVPGALSFSASAPGLTNLGDGESYTLRPKASDEVTINITAKMPDGTSIVENKKFKILPYPTRTITVNGDYCYSCIYEMSRDKIKNLKIGSIFVPMSPFCEDEKVDFFTLKIPGIEKMIVFGDKLDEKAIKAIGEAKENDLIIIDEVKLILGNCPILPRKISPTLIRIKNSD